MIDKKKEVKRVMAWLKKTGYANEKTPKQRELRNIKRQTRYYFPLKNHFCEFCGGKATEHHHNTNPIQFDRFNFVCHECHLKIHNSKGGKEDGRK